LGPAVRRHFNDPADLRCGEWIRQQVVSSEVENFRPKPIVSQPGQYNQGRHPVFAGLQISQHIPPISVG
jgi:hypothetical protein